MYDFPRAGKPTMTMTSLAATSRLGILPSGETLERVIPGMFSVVAWGRTRGVWLPEFCRNGGLLFPESARRLCGNAVFGPTTTETGDCVARQQCSTEGAEGSTYMRGEFGAVDVRLRA